MSDKKLVCNHSNTESEIIREYLRTTDLGDASLNSSAMLAHKIDTALKHAGLKSRFHADYTELNSAHIHQHTELVSLVDLMKKADLEPDIIQSIKELIDRHTLNIRNEIRAQMMSDQSKYDISQINKTSEKAEGSLSDHSPTNMLSRFGRLMNIAPALSETTSVVADYKEAWSRVTPYRESGVISDDAAVGYADAIAKANLVNRATMQLDPSLGARYLSKWADEYHISNSLLEELNTTGVEITRVLNEKDYES